MLAPFVVMVATSSKPGRNLHAEFHLHAAPPSVWSRTICARLCQVPLLHFLLNGVIVTGDLRPQVLINAGGLWRAGQVAAFAAAPRCSARCWSAC